MKRSGVVLLVTLAILLTLSTLIFLFLQNVETVRNDSLKNRLMLQTNFLLKDLSAFLASLELDEEAIVYSAGIPVSLEIDPVKALLSIDSAQKGINLNLYLAKAKEMDESYAQFGNFLARYEVQNPRLLMGMLIDTLDDDLYESIRGAEIILFDPKFQNGKIENFAHLEHILHAYAAQSGDQNASKIAWRDLFCFDCNSTDLNFATLDQLLLLYGDTVSTSVLQQIAEHLQVYSKPADLPFDEEIKTALGTTLGGVKANYKTELIRSFIELEDANCRMSLNFVLDLKKKSAGNLEIGNFTCD